MKMTPFFQPSRSMVGKIFGGIYAEMRSSIEVQVTSVFVGATLVATLCCTSVATKVVPTGIAFIGVRHQSGDLPALHNRQQLLMRLPQRCFCRFPIHTRIRDGHTVFQFRQVITNRLIAGM
jgi:hypothetical protein